MLPKLKGKVLILGIGNPMKQDDGAGPAAIAELKTQNSKVSRFAGSRKTLNYNNKEAGKTNVELLDVGPAPENYTGKIKQIRPDTLVIVDAIDFGEKAGSIKVIEAEQIGSQSLSTHNVSLKTFVDYLKTDLSDLEVIVVGIQPKTANFGEGLSPEVGKAVDELCMSLV